MRVVGLLSTKEEAEEIKYIAKIFVLSLRIHDLVAEHKEKDKHE